MTVWRNLFFRGQLFNQTSRVFWTCSCMWKKETAHTLLSSHVQSLHNHFLWNSLSPSCVIDCGIIVGATGIWSPWRHGGGDPAKQAHPKLIKKINKAHCPITIITGAEGLAVCKERGQLIFGIIKRVMRQVCLMRGTLMHHVFPFLVADLSQGWAILWSEIS